MTKPFVLLLLSLLLACCTTARPAAIDPTTMSVNAAEQKLAVETVVAIVADFVPPAITAVALDVEDIGFGDQLRAALAAAGFGLTAADKAEVLPNSARVAVALLATQHNLVLMVTVGRDRATTLIARGTTPGWNSPVTVCEGCAR